MPGSSQTKKHSVLTKITTKDLDREQAGVFYRFRDCFITNDMGEEIRQYIEKGIKPHPFLAAVICNNLIAACFQANDAIRPNIPAYVAYFYWEAPSPCWGSKLEMDAWIEIKGDKP